MLLLVSQNEAETYYCLNEKLALETAKYHGFFTKPGDKSFIYELGDDLIPTVY
jgi:hypothetical protein